jgi:hypothetical protein
MAVDLDKLRADYAKITEKNRSAYDALYSRFTTGAEPSVSAQYEEAVKKGTVTAAQKAEYEKLSAAYKQTQEAKNSLKQQIDAAEKAAKTDSTKGAKLKSAQVAADKAIGDLKVAEAKINDYNGQDNYISAYQAAQLANKTLGDLGGKVTELPEAKVTIPPVGTKLGPDGKPQIDTSKIAEPTFTEIQNTLADPKNSAMLKDWQTALAKNFGYKGNVDGQWSIPFQTALQSAYTTRASLPDAVKGPDLQTFVIHPTISVVSSGTSKDGTSVTTYQTVSSDTSAKSEINALFQKQFSRDATDAELKVLMPALKNAQAKNPAKYTTTTSGGNSSTKQVTGLDTNQFLTDTIAKGVDGKLPQLKSEFEKSKLNAPEVTQRNADKLLYDNAVKAGKDASATTYGRGIAALADRIGMQAITAGAQMDKATIDAIAKEAYDKALDKDPYAFQSFVDSKLKFGADTKGNYTGAAGKYIADLQATAAANGLDLNKNFGSNIQDWLTNLQKGEAIDTYKNIIRQTASLGMPEKVAGLLKNGVDLATIYSPYKNALAQTLEISPESITLSDPSLRQAITPTGEMSIYDYTRQLRQDPRWQYTNQARGETADAVTKVLNDFGFKG